MEYKKVDAMVKEIIAAHMVISSARIEDMDTLADDLGFDSFDMIEISMAIEDKFGIDILDIVGSEDIITVKDLTEFIVENIK